MMAILVAVLMSAATALVFEIPSRPFTTGEAVLLYLLCLMPSLGVAMLFDPSAQKAKEDFLKINFYEEK